MVVLDTLAPAERLAFVLARTTHRRTSGQLQSICDDLLEASIPGQFKDASTSLAVLCRRSAGPSATTAQGTPKASRNRKLMPKFLSPSTLTTATRPAAA